MLSLPLKQKKCGQGVYVRNFMSYKLLYDAPFRIITPFNPFNPKKKYENENGNKNHQIIRSFVMMSRGELVMMIKIGKNSANLPKLRSEEAIHYKAKKRI